MKLSSIVLLFGVAVALPTSKGKSALPPCSYRTLISTLVFAAGTDADEVAKNSWSASNLNNRVADADEAVKNSWSASNLNNRVPDVDEAVKNSWSASNLDNRVADADEVVKNSWSAGMSG